MLVLITATYAILQTITFSLYLYSAEIYPTRLRCVGGGFGSTWLRAGSSIGPILVGFIVSDFGIRYVFSAFAAAALVGGVVTLVESGHCPVQRAKLVCFASFQDALASSASK